MRDKLRVLQRLVAHIPVRAVGRWLGIFVFALVIVSLGGWFIRATLSAWNVEHEGKVSCGFDLDRNSPFSYIQYNVKDQAIEPYFQGSIFINLGDILSGPSQVELVTTAKGNYGNTDTHVEFFRDEANKQFWMRKESTEVPFYRASGSHRDFPLDSTTIDFDTTSTTPLAFRGVLVRNLNPSFYIPCDTYTINRDAPGKIHVHFEMRRNPLVQVMAVVILAAAAVFVLLIPFTVKQEALPTSIASFFFSIWSIRGILSSEMKVFPTALDVAILFLCVLLLLLIGIRLLLRWIKPSPTT
jgi:hypothetical protein